MKRENPAKPDDAVVGRPFRTRPLGVDRLLAVLDWVREHPVYRLLWSCLLGSELVSLRLVVSLSRRGEPTNALLLCDE